MKRLSPLEKFDYWMEKNQPKMREFVQLFGQQMVDTEIKKMRSWIVGNNAHRSRWGRFMSIWLNKEYSDQGGQLTGTAALKAVGERIKRGEL